MYDLRTLRDNLDAIREQLGPRGADVQWDNLRKLIEERRTLTGQVEQWRHEVKKFSEEIGRLMREKKLDEAQRLRDAMGMSTVVPQIGISENNLRSVEERVDDLALRIPNLPHS